MSESDPIVFAALAAGMPDNELITEIHTASPISAPPEWLQALVDEASARRIEISEADLALLSSGGLFH
ncbi:hypothetical protein LWE61_08235 [Sphingobium sufflavum]|uniref:hypothetical protein n=1 Tax=Sphingobium sufflavum TaxID=1129547 RepID=UPI001F42E157|nr:hypothetical protein [Sphingobium sufflavum]MCE7796550.1 hypothetical protein [Sphingobium sufflavum]